MSNCVISVCVCRCQTNVSKRALKHTPFITQLPVFSSSTRWHLGDTITPCDSTSGTGLSETVTIIKLKISKDTRLRLHWFLFNWFLACMYQMARRPAHCWFFQNLCFKMILLYTCSKDSKQGLCTNLESSQSINSLAESKNFEMCNPGVEFRLLQLATFRVRVFFSLCAFIFPFFFFKPWPIKLEATKLLRESVSHSEYCLSTRHFHEPTWIDCKTVGAQTFFPVPNSSSFSLRLIQVLK